MIMKVHVKIHFTFVTPHLPAGVEGATEVSKCHLQLQLLAVAEKNLLLSQNINTLVQFL